MDSFQDYVSLARSFGMVFPPQTFALVVEGDCMNAGAICDGDVVFLQPGKPKHGDVVAALIRGKGKTLKRYHKENGKATLRADSPGYPEFPITDDVTFDGVMVGLLRGAYRRAERRTDSRKGA